MNGLLTNCSASNPKSDFLCPKRQRGLRGIRPYSCEVPTEHSQALDAVSSPSATYHRTPCGPGRAAAPRTEQCASVAAYWRLMAPMRSSAASTRLALRRASCPRRLEGDVDEFRRRFAMLEAFGDDAKRERLHARDGFAAVVAVSHATQGPGLQPATGRVFPADLDR